MFRLFFGKSTQTLKLGVFTNTMETHFSVSVAEILLVKIKKQHILSPYTCNSWTNLLLYSHKVCSMFWGNTH